MEPHCSGKGCGASLRSYAKSVSTAPVDFQHTCYLQPGCVVGVVRLLSFTIASFTDAGASSVQGVFEQAVHGAPVHRLLVQDLHKIQEVLAPRKHSFRHFNCVLECDYFPFDNVQFSILHIQPSGRRKPNGSQTTETHFQVNSTSIFTSK